MSDAPKIPLLYLLIFALYSLLTLHSVYMEGYFVDGMIYASIARNLSEGYGSFWDLRFSDELFLHFKEHPPLGIYIQSLAFSAFGDTEYIDKFYGYIIGFAILLSIAKIHNKVSPSSHGNWFPVITFILFPLTGYVLSYNWLEHILTLNILISSLFIISAIQINNFHQKIGLSLLAGMFIFSGLMIKGPVSLYPLSILIFYYTYFKGTSAANLVVTFIIITIVNLALFGCIVLIYKEALVYFNEYLFDQVIGSISGNRSVHSSTKLLESLVTEELIVPIVIYSFLMFSCKCNWKHFRTNNNKITYFYLSIALSGSVPLMFVPKQNDYYLFISLPFYALTISTLFEPLRVCLVKRITNHQFIRISIIIILMLTVVLMYAKSGNYRKDSDYHKSFTDFRVALPKRSLVYACPSSIFYSNWNIAANLQRYYSATLSSSDEVEYLLTTPEHKERCTMNITYTEISKSGTPYMLLKIISQ